MIETVLQSKIKKGNRLRILLYSHWFAPSTGGVETISEILAEEFVRAGSTVTVVTRSEGPESNAPYGVFRRPSMRVLRALAKESDVIFQNTISVRTLVVWLFCGKPIVVTHHSWLRRSTGHRGLENYTKLLLLRFCFNIAISKAIAKELPVSCLIIGNPFESSAFSAMLGRVRDRDIVFMGRLIPEKGCDVLLRALGQLKFRNVKPTLTVIGDGSERETLERLTESLGLEGQVQFVGTLREGRGEMVARHRVMAVPSTWAEPFGVVALEGIASGCAIVASSMGGLPDAVGPCGLYFQNGDVDGLSDALERVLTDEPLRLNLIGHGVQHLAQFQPETVAARYLELFEQVVSKNAS
jgi:glycosyltransferase involved in cell wall biosynthesis